MELKPESGLSPKGGSKKASTVGIVIAAAVLISLLYVVFYGGC